LFFLILMPDPHFLFSILKGPDSGRKKKKQQCSIESFESNEIKTWNLFTGTGTVIYSKICNDLMVYPEYLLKDCTQWIFYDLKYRKCCPNYNKIFVCLKL